MKPRYALLYIAFFTAGSAAAQPPAGYYNAAAGKTGEALRAALCNIIKGHNELTYTPGLWNAYYATDVKANGKLATIYSDKPGAAPPYEFTLGADQCGSATPGSEGGCYNREHVWPRTYFGGAVAPMNTDLWIVYPTDAKVNSQRANNPYGKVSSPAWTSQNGTKLGPQAYPGAPSGTAFEPIDSFKGDIARSYFYISTRYFADSAQFQTWDMAYNSRLKPWAIQMLLDWHRSDPVSKKEKDRNEAAYALQANRNPFIDDPRYAECIWAGNCSGLTLDVPRLAGISIRVAPNPATSNVTIDWQTLAPDEVLAVDVLNIQGQILCHKAISTPGVSFSVAGWPKGLYQLLLRTQHGVLAEKLVVE